MKQVVWGSTEDEILAKDLTDEIVVLVDDRNNKIGLLHKKGFNGPYHIYQDMSEYGLSTGNCWDKNGTSNKKKMIDMCKSGSYKLYAFELESEAYMFIGNKFASWGR